MKPPPIPGGFTSILPARFTSRRLGAFTLIEVIVSIAVLSILLIILLQVSNLVSNIYTRTKGGVSAFQDASVAADSMARRLAQATLNTYWDYYPSQSGASPAAPQIYIRQSELHFVAGKAASLLTGGGADNNPTHAIFFQAPLGYTNTLSYVANTEMLNACGYYIAFGDDTKWRPNLPGLTRSSKMRFRLMEVLDPSESMGVYTDTSTTSYTWINDAISRGNVRAIADNIIALIVEPKLTAADLAANNNVPLTTDYSYNSRYGTVSTTSNPAQPIQQHQLPPMLNVTMVAIDEISAQRLAAQYGSSPPSLFGTATFSTTDQLDSDMNTLKSYLQKHHITYRVFNSEIPLRSAKWSSK
ncbi:MAG: Verru_Chthon cassette protein C [Chthoniobacteraceae bacterium]